MSRPASGFGAPVARPAAADPFADLPASALAGRLDVLCLRPIHHVLEFEEMERLLGLLRARAPQARIHLSVGSALRDDAPFERLGVHRVERLTEYRGPGALAAGLRRFVVERADGGVCVLLGAPRGWRRVAGLRVAAAAPLGFRAGSEGTEAGARFLAAVQRESPHWVADPAALPPPARGAAMRFLVHQSRFHAAGVLSLTPLLREIRRRFRGAEITVVGPPAAAEVLAGNPRVADLQIYEPREGEAGRRRVLAGLAGLAGRRFDAALFAFARRRESRWLAEAAAGWGVPYRINLEDHDLRMDDSRPWGPLTHEGWFFRGSMARPRMLVHALDPLLGPEPWEQRFAGARRVEFHVPDDARPRAAEVLAAHGIGKEPFVLLCPGEGASRVSRGWPAESFARLALLLTSHFGLHVLVEGGSGGGEVLLAEIEARVRQGRAFRRIAVARDPLPVVAALLEKARLLVANDGLPIHLAEAVGAPTLYFARRADLTRSHPRTAACWALFDDVGDDPAAITVEQALGAVRQMTLGGAIRGFADR